MPFSHIKSKTISFLLVFFLCLLCGSALLVSCDEGKPQTDGGTAETSSADNGRDGVPDGLGEYDFGGRDFRVLVRDGAGNSTCHHVQEIYSEGEIGEVINDAVYRRNQTVEARFNANIKAVPAKEVPEDTITRTVIRDVRAGDDAYDLIVGHMIHLGVLAPEKVLVDWYDMPVINYGNPWWIQSAREELSVGGRSFFNMSQLCYSLFDYTYCIYFNKRLIGNYNITDTELYQAVRDGDWTIDYLINIVKDIYIDLDNDGKRSPDDFYGFIGNMCSALDKFSWAFDNFVSKKDENGIPEIVLNNPKTMQIVEKLYDFCYNTKGVFMSPVNVVYKSTSMSWVPYAYTKFPSGEALFATGEFYDATTLFTSMEDAYGVLPYPKWDKAQGKYRSMVDGHGPLMAIPATVKDRDKEFVSVMVEALSAESYKQVTPAYYEVALKLKYTHDEESAEMLDIIIDGITYDFAYIYDGFRGISFYLSDLIPNNSRDFTSYYERKIDAAQKYYDRITAAYLEY